MAILDPLVVLIRKMLFDAVLANRILASKNDDALLARPVLGLRCPPLAVPSVSLKSLITRIHIYDDYLLRSKVVTSLPISSKPSDVAAPAEQ
jgi:hypothetical protein